MLIELLFETLHSRYLATDAIRQLWNPLKRVADSPFTDAILKTRLYIVLAAMTYWVKAQQRYPVYYEPKPEQPTAEVVHRQLVELVNNPISPDSAAVAAFTRMDVEQVQPIPATETLVPQTLSELLQKALVDQQRGSSAQSTAWYSVVDALVAQNPVALKKKKRKLLSMNPLRAAKKQSTAEAVVVEQSVPLQSTFMKTIFHPPPPIAHLFSLPRMAVLATVFPETVVQVPNTVVEFHQLLERMRAKLHAGPALRFVVDRKRHHDRKHGHQRAISSDDNNMDYGYSDYSKKLDSVHSLRAVYAPNVPARTSSSTEYTKALQVLAVLEGRFKHYVERGGVRAEAAQLDKSGLTTIVIEQQDLAIDLPTSVFVVLATLEFSSRKAFTLEAQQQGALNPALQFILREALEAHADITHWSIVCHVYPNAEIAARLTTDQRRVILDQWMGYQPLLARFLQCQWVKGVNVCATRRMLVPRCGGEVDSDGWNRAAGAWNNSLRFVRLLADDVPGHPLHGRTIFKCLKLTAGDQMAWAERDGKEPDHDADIFRDLVADDAWLPWDGLPSSGKAVDALAALPARIEELCAQYKVPVHKWLGRAQARRSDEVKTHGPMICGVAVSSSVTTAQAQALKQMGFAGSKP